MKSPGFVELLSKAVRVFADFFTSEKAMTQYVRITSCGTNGWSRMVFGKRIGGDTKFYKSQLEAQNAVREVMSLHLHLLPLCHQEFITEIDLKRIK